MKLSGSEGKPDEHNCGIQRQPALFECPSNLTPQHPSCKSWATNCDSHGKGDSWVMDYVWIITYVIGEYLLPVHICSSICYSTHLLGCCGSRDNWWVAVAEYVAAGEVPPESRPIARLQGPKCRKKSWSDYLFDNSCNGFHWLFIMCIYIPTAEKSAITFSVIAGRPGTPAIVGKIPSLGSLKMEIKFSSLESVLFMR